MQQGQKGTTENTRESKGNKGRAEKQVGWLNIHKGCLVMGSDVGGEGDGGDGGARGE